MKFLIVIGMILALMIAACGGSESDNTSAASATQTPDSSSRPAGTQTSDPGPTPSDEPEYLDAKALVERGIAYYEQGEFYLAFIDFNDSKEIYPEYAPGYLWIGITLFDDGTFGSAAGKFTEAIRIDPQLVVAYVKLGETYLALDLPERAILEADKAISIDSGEASAYVLRGLFHEAMGDEEQAKEAYGDAIKLDPSGARAFFLRGEIYANEGPLNRGDGVLALRDFDEAIRLDPGNAEWYYARSEEYERIEDLESVLDDLNEAIRLDPENPYFFMRRGYFVANQLPTLPERTADWDRACELDISFCRISLLTDAELDALKSAYYQQHQDYKGITIQANNDVNPRALEVVAAGLDRMFLRARPDIFPKFVKRRVEISVYPKGELMSTLPGYELHQPNSLGAGGRDGAAVPEENLLHSLSEDRQDFDLNVLFHELGHVFMFAGFTSEDFEIAETLFDDAKGSELFFDTYARTGFMEFWAEITAYYFGHGHFLLGSPEQIWGEIPEAFLFLEHIYRNQPLPESVAALAR